MCLFFLSDQKFFSFYLVVESEIICRYSLNIRIDKEYIKGTKDTKIICEIRFVFLPIKKQNG